MTSLSGAAGNICADIPRPSVVSLSVLDIAAAAAAAVVSAVLLAFFHDRFWWAADDATFGYAAMMMLRDGAGTYQDAHPGYVHYLHLAAMKLFGENLLSMRYPLMAATFIQAMVAYVLLLPKGRLAAFTAAMVMSALSTLMFINPTPNWYALSLTVMLIGAARWMTPGTALRIVVLGFMAGQVLLMRQLTGVFVAMGVVTLLLMERRDEQAGRALIARMLLVAMVLVLAFYFINKLSVPGFLLYGLAPTILLLIAIRRVEASDDFSIEMIRWLVLGGLLAAAPRGLFELANGTFLVWLRENTTGLLTISAVFENIGFLGSKSILVFFLQALISPLANFSVSASINALFWVALVAAPAALAISFISRVVKDDGRTHWLALPVIAIFYMPVSAHYQTYIYLAHSVPLVLVALLWLWSDTRHAHPVRIAMLALCAVGVIFHAAQPLTRTTGEIVAGVRKPLDNATPLPRARLKVTAASAETHRRITAIIEAHSGADDRIVAAPFIPQMYFLSGRRSWLGKVGLVHEMLSAADLDAALARLKTDPPKVVVHKRHDKYNSLRALAFIEAVRRDFRRYRTIGGYDVYLPRSRDTRLNPDPVSNGMRGTRP